jgi:hypothetical protein
VHVFGFMVAAISRFPMSLEYGRRSSACLRAATIFISILRRAPLLIGGDNDAGLSDDGHSAQYRSFDGAILRNHLLFYPARAFQIKVQ